MPAQIQFSNCGKPEIENEVCRRASEMFRNVPESWIVSVSGASPGAWNMSITGPSHFRYDLDLNADSGEQNAEFILSAIKQAIVGETSG
jgi:hypothetical protein